MRESKTTPKKSPSPGAARHPLPVTGERELKHPAQQHFIYILQSGDGRLYTGYTTDIERRLAQHQAGLGAKFTRAFGANKILYQESFPNKSLALKREALIKSWPRKKKLALITSKTK